MNAGSLPPTVEARIHSRHSNRYRYRSCSHRFSILFFSLYTLQTPTPGLCACCKHLRKSQDTRQKHNRSPQAEGRDFCQRFLSCKWSPQLAKLRELFRSVAVTNRPCGYRAYRLAATRSESLTSLNPTPPTSQP